MRAVIAYDGSKFHGYQAQKHTRQTVEGALGAALAALGIRTNLLASGRTDAGVHALRQVVSFSLPPVWQDLSKLRGLLNKRLDGIYLRSLTLTHADFHPRFDARSRIYRYVLNTKSGAVFLQNYALFCPALDLGRINAALSVFCGTHDFALFRKNGSGEKTTTRTIHKAYAYAYKDLIVINIEADAFLRSMVRLICAAVLECARGRLSLGDLRAQLDGKRRAHSKPLPPQGLYLARVKY